MFCTICGGKDHTAKTCKYDEAYVLVRENGKVEHHTKLRKVKK